MIQKDITAQREILNTETAVEFVKSAMEYQSTLGLETNGHCVNPKSLLGVMCLGIKPGSPLNLTADGPDEVDAIQKLTAFFNVPLQTEP